MASSGMLRRVPLVRTDVSEELSASIIRVTRIGEIGKTLAANLTRFEVFMPSYGMVRSVAVVRTDVSDEHSTSTFRLTTISELGTLAITSNRLTLPHNVTAQEMTFFINLLTFPYWFGVAIFTYNIKINGIVVEYMHSSVRTQFNNYHHSTSELH
jgi:hypothetical protein